jgi:hypothetical protein
MKLTIQNRTVDRDGFLILFLIEAIAFMFAPVFSYSQTQGSLLYV